MGIFFEYLFCFFVVVVIAVVVVVVVVPLDPLFLFWPTRFDHFFGFGRVCVCVCGCNLVIFMLLFRLLLASTGLVPCFTGRYLADKNRSASTTENETKRMGTKKKTLL